MPAFVFEYEHSKLEGVQFRFQTQPVAIRAAASDAGRGGALEIVEMKLGPPDASGRSRPEPVAGSNFLIECDMVIPAIGQSRFLEFLEKCRGIEVRHGTVAVDAATGRTANPRYYAGGDCVNGRSQVADHVSESTPARAGSASC